MTIDEMIERLNEYRDQLGGDAEVRMMQQPNWPFQYHIGNVVSGEEINNVKDGSVHDRVVYVCEGPQIGYGSKCAWDV